MKKQELKERQAELKAVYQREPDAAQQTLSAVATLDFDNLACKISRPAFLDPAGLHPSSGGDGTFACPVEIMLAGLVSCAGVTLTAVASSMHLNITKGRVIAEGDMDFCGTLGCNKAAPVGVTAIRLSFELETKEEQSKIDKLIELTHRYCVVHRTLDAPPAVEVKVNLI
jgi:uncharacterized OsmC-like protein